MLSSCRKPMEPSSLGSQVYLLEQDESAIKSSQTNDLEHELTPLDRFTRSVSGTGQRSRSGSRHLSKSPSPRKRGNASPWDDDRGSRSGSVNRSRSRSINRVSIRCVLILDWDDTLFPTTWIRDDCGFDWRKPLEAQLDKWSVRGKTTHTLLERFAARMSALLREASREHHVIIVTLARKGWVMKSIERFCPALKEVIEECKPKIIYAQEYASATKRRWNGAPMTADEALEFWTEVKASAIRKELSSEATTFTDIVSVGDSQYERHGTMRVASEFMKELGDGADKPRMHVKTVKFLNCPTVEEVTAQMNLLLCWLPFIVDRDDDLDIEIDEADDDILNSLDQVVRGKVCSCGISLPPDAFHCPACNLRRPKGPKGQTEPLAWSELAEMEERHGSNSSSTSATDHERPTSAERMNKDISDELSNQLEALCGL